MSTTAPSVIAAAKVLAQESAATPLLAQSTDYAIALRMALGVFAADVPNRRVVHYPVTASAFRFVLSGTGAILTGLDAWTPGRSLMYAVWHPYSTTAQGQSPLDENNWRVVEEPGLTLLELLDRSPSLGVLRLEYESPHQVHDSDTAQTTVRAGHVDALETLLASQILNLYAARAVQNSGSTGIPADVVDGRSQSDQARSRARDLFTIYKSMVGTSSGDDVRPASCMVDLDIDASHGWGFQWHPKGSR